MTEHDIIASSYIHLQRSGDSCFRYFDVAHHKDNPFSVRKLKKTKYLFSESLLGPL